MNPNPATSVGGDASNTDLIVSIISSFRPADHDAVDSTLSSRERVAAVELARLRSSSAADESRCLALERECSLLHARLTELQSITKNHHSELTNLTSDLSAAKAAEIQARREADEWRRKYSDIKVKAVKVGDENAALKVKIESLTKNQYLSLVTLSGEIDLAKAAEQRAREEANACQRKCGDIEGRMVEVGDENAVLMERIEGLEKEKEAGVWGKRVRGYDDRRVEMEVRRGSGVAAMNGYVETSEDDDDENTRMACNSSASKVMEDTQTNRPLTNKTYSIHVDECGMVSGPDASKFGTRCGALIRALVPVSYKDWRLVDDAYLNDFWTSLFKEFEMNCKPQSARCLLDSKLSQYFRTQKYALRKKFIRTAVNKHDAIAARPDDIDRVVWDAFVDNEWDEKKMEQCRKNAANRAQNTINHSLGRKPYSRVYAEIKKANGGVSPTRSVAWKEAHIGKDGKVLASAQEKWDEIVAVETKRKDASVKEVDSDIEHDELAEVFGPDKMSRCRAISSNSSLKKVKRVQAIKEIAKQKNIMHEDYHERMEATVKETVEATMKATMEAKMRSSVEAIVKESLKDFYGLVGMQPKAGIASNISVDTPSTEGASNSIRDNVAGESLHALTGASNPTQTSGEKYVMLLSRDKEEVAKGYIANRDICHGRQVGRNERVVWVTEVKDPKARIFKAPQDGNYKLSEIADGGFLIWLEGRLRYL